MKDIPFFTTQYGAASLTLSQIPYTGDSYIRIQSVLDGMRLLQECVDFCRAAGASRVYATGDEVTMHYPFHTQIWRMCCERACIPKTDAVLVSVNDDTLEQWRTIHNDKMRYVPNAAFMNLSAANKLLETCSAYYVVRKGQTLGIGAVEGAEIRAIASTVSGSGKDIVSALNSALTGEIAFVEVASENHTAIGLYERMGFVQDQLIAQWHKII